MHLGLITCLNFLNAKNPKTKISFKLLKNAFYWVLNCKSSAVDGHLSLMKLNFPNLVLVCIFSVVMDGRPRNCSSEDTSMLLLNGQVTKSYDGIAEEIKSVLH